VEEGGDEDGPGCSGQGKRKQATRRCVESDARPQRGPKASFARDGRSSGAAQLGRRRETYRIEFHVSERNRIRSERAGKKPDSNNQLGDTRGCGRFSFCKCATRSAACA